MHLLAAMQLSVPPSLLPCPALPWRRREPRSSWEATFLCWVKQETGLGRVLLEGLGLETVVRFNSPAQVSSGGTSLWQVAAQ